MISARSGSQLNPGQEPYFRSESTPQVILLARICGTPADAGQRKPHTPAADRGAGAGARSSANGRTGDGGTTAADWVAGAGSHRADAGREPPTPVAGKAADAGAEHNADATTTVGRVTALGPQGAHTTIDGSGRHQNHTFRPPDPNQLVEPNQVVGRKQRRMCPPPPLRRAHRAWSAAIDPTVGSTFQDHDARPLRGERSGHRRTASGHEDTPVADSHQRRPRPGRRDGDDTSDASGRQAAAKAGGTPSADAKVATSSGHTDRAPGRSDADMPTKADRAVGASGKHSAHASTTDDGAAATGFGGAGTTADKVERHQDHDFGPPYPKQKLGRGQGRACPPYMDRAMGSADGDPCHSNHNALGAQRRAPQLPIQFAPSRTMTLDHIGVWGEGDDAGQEADMKTTPVADTATNAGLDQADARKRTPQTPAAGRVASTGGTPSADAQAATSAGCADTRHQAATR